MALKEADKAGDKGTAEAEALLQLCCSSVAALLQLCCVSAEAEAQKHTASESSSKAQVKRKQSASTATYEPFIVVKSLTKKTTKAAHRQRLRNTHSARICSLPTPHLRRVLFWVSIYNRVLREVLVQILTIESSFESIFVLLYESQRPSWKYSFKSVFVLFY
jgi:hypothetical protein